MKRILHARKKSVFETWLHSYLSGTSVKYIWPQICYDWNTGKILHVVFEKNNGNKDYVEWPMFFEGIPQTNIDFTSSRPVLDDGSAWDYHQWHIKALGCTLQSTPSKEPSSFWDWRLDTRPQGNATCDLDFLCRSNSKQLIGIEATEIYYIDENTNPNKDVFEHFQRLLRMRKGRAKGFNIKQLKVQSEFVKSLEGRLFFLLHQINKETQLYHLRDDKIALLEINEENLIAIENIISQNQYKVSEPRAAYGVRKKDVDNPMSLVKDRLIFLSMGSVFKSFVR